MSPTIPAFTTSPAKAETRQDTLNVLREARNHLLDRAGLLRRDWIELAGPEAPTLRLLLDQHFLGVGSNAKFIGVDRDKPTLEHAASLYGSEAPAVWIQADLLSLIEADRNAFPNAGVLVFDGFNNMRGAEAYRALDVLFAFAKSRSEDHMGFLLVLNFSTSRQSKVDQRRFQAETEKRYGAPIPWTVYRSDEKYHDMNLARLRFGY